MQEAEFIQSMQTLEIKENDILVVKIDAPIPMDTRHRIFKHVTDMLPVNMKGKVSVLVLDKEVDIGVIRKEEL